MEQNTKYLHHIPLIFLILNRIIFRFDDFQSHHPLFIPTIHMFLSINESLRNLLLKSTIVVVTFFLNVFLWYCSYTCFTTHLKTFENGFFSCVWFQFWTTQAVVLGGDWFRGYYHSRGRLDPQRPTVLWTGQTEFFGPVCQGLFGARLSRNNNNTRREQQ